MADTIDLLIQKRDAAEAAARHADFEAGSGVPGATRRAETLHREAQFFSARLARLEADPAELLKSLYLERETIRTAGSAAKEDEQVDALAARLTHLDRHINALENPHGKVH